MEQEHSNERMLQNFGHNSHTDNVHTNSKQSPLRPHPKRESPSDRFIPIRTGNEEQVTPSLWTQSPNTPEKNPTYNMILRKELFGDSGIRGSKTSPNRILKYHSTKSCENSPFSLSPLSEESQRVLCYPRTSPPRKIPKHPFKILEAPAIQDDFYLNLVDWSSQNVLAVGLKNCVYLLNVTTGFVTKLSSLPNSEETVTSLAWIDKGDQLAVGTSRGIVQLWDVTASECVRSMTGHKHRVSALAWNSYLLSSGGRDRTIYHRDIRVNSDFVSKLSAHKQEICGLKWSHDGQFLASGGNDNKLHIWDSVSPNPLAKFSDHIAAVKALAWSPHQRGLLASGGGTADRCIKFWNVLNSSCLHSMDTGSQVCNLIWSKNVNEVVSTHGFSQNQIVVWSYPSLSPIATLVGHTMRVLYLSMSPDCQTIVTGAGDETLRFWNVFPRVGDRNAMLSKIEIR